MSLLIAIALFERISIIPYSGLKSRSPVTDPMTTRIIAVKERSDKNGIYRPDPVKVMGKEGKRGEQPERMIPVTTYANTDSLVVQGFTVIFRVVTAITLAHRTST